MEIWTQTHTERQSGDDTGSRRPCARPGERPRVPACLAWTQPSVPETLGRLPPLVQLLAPYRATRNTGRAGHGCPTSPRPRPGTLPSSIRAGGDARPFVSSATGRFTGSCHLQLSTSGESSCRAQRRPQHRPTRAVGARTVAAPDSLPPRDRHAPGLPVRPRLPELARTPGHQVRCHPPALRSLHSRHHFKNLTPASAGGPALGSLLGLLGPDGWLIAPG